MPTVTMQKPTVRVSFAPSIMSSIVSTSTADVAEGEPVRGNSCTVTDRSDKLTSVSKEL